MGDMSIKRILDNNRDELIKKKHVVGVGIGYKYTKGQKTDEVSIVVFVERKVPRASLDEKDIIPAEIEGTKTDVREKTFRAFTTPEEKQGRWRPAKGGVSIGHNKITAGTLGILIRDREGGEQVILSNNHVLANSNNAETGDKIYQPGSFDGGEEEDTIAELKRFIPIEFEQGSECPVARLIASIYNAVSEAVGARTRLSLIKAAYNEVDAAIASPLSSEYVENGVIDLTTPHEASEPRLGMKVCKSGRTTCLTHGEIDTIDLVIRVSYGYYDTALFHDQIGIQPLDGKFSQGGDSGSVILTEEGELVGLLFAGDESGYTIANKFSRVMELLEIELI